jgi:ubiquinone/menaquinone biosynthesis C-methylase UbiE
MKEKWTDGDAYEMYVGRWSRKVGAGFLNWLAAPIGVHWLDLGCGTGALTSQILELNNPASVVGVEPSAEFLALATQQLRDPCVQFRRGSAGALPLEENSVQQAVSGLVLNFLSDVGGAMRDLIRVTQPGGIIASYVWDYAGACAVHALFLGCCRGAQSSR